MGRFGKLKNLVKEYFIDVFREHPVLLPIAAIAVLGQISAASVNSFALSFYVLNDLKQPGHVLGYLTSSYLIVEAALKLPFGHLSDRIGRRPVVVGGLLLTLGLPLAVVFIPIRAIATHPILIYLVLLPMRVLGGAGAAAIWPPLFAEVPERIPVEKRGTAMAVVNSTYSFGIAVGPALAGFVGSLFGKGPAHGTWYERAPFAMAAGAVVLCVLAARFLPKDRVWTEKEEEQPRGQLPPWSIIAVIMLVTGSELFATSSLAPYLAPFVTITAHITKEQAGYLLLLLGVPVVIIGIPAGRLTDRWPKARVRKVALWVSALGMWPVPFLHNVYLIMACGGIVVLGFLFGAPAWLALISDLAPKGREGVMMGILATAEGAGAFAGPFVSGYLWDISIRDPFFSAAGALTLAALVAVLFVHEWEEEGEEKQSGQEAEFAAD